MVVRLLFLLFIMGLVACTATSPESPRLIQEETLAPASATPLALNSALPSLATPMFTPTLLQTEASFRLRTPTPPNSATPSITPTFTPTLLPSPTRSLTPSRTFTPSITPTPTITLSPSITPTFSQTPVQASPSCSFTWFFSPAPPNCPLTAPLTSSAAYQSMQNGRMIWIQNGLTIYVMFDTIGTPMWAFTPDLYQDGEALNLGEAPAGYFLPQRGFGKFWRDFPSARERLGWALEPEVGYTALVQADSVTGTRYVSGAKGEIFALMGGGESWQRVQ